MSNNKDLIITNDDFYNSQEIRKILSDKKPEKIIFDFTNFESIYSSFLGLMILVVKENEDLKINAKIIYKNPNHLVEKVLRQVKLLNFGEIIIE